MKRSSRYLFSLVLLCVANLNTALAQTAQGTITGRVLDSTSAAIPRVNVQVVNVGTNQAVQLVTDGSGAYTAPFLQPGTYSVSVEAAGFKKMNRGGLILGVNQVLSVDVVLEVGSTTEQVTITAEAPLLETSNADRGGVIDEKRVHELPINGRNPFMLGRLVAGVSFSGQAVWERPFDNGAPRHGTSTAVQTAPTSFSSMARPTTRRPVETTSHWCRRWIRSRSSRFKRTLMTRSMVTPEEVSSTSR
jgi:hypothetical protein